MASILYFMNKHGMPYDYYASKLISLMVDADIYAIPNVLFRAAGVDGTVVCLGVAYILYSGRQSRIKHDFHLRPMWVEVMLALVGWATIIGSVLLVNSYPWPKGIVRQYGARIGQDLEGSFIKLALKAPS